MKSVAFCTLGCKVNQYETDAMEEMFAAAGYEIREFREKSDIYIINTCTVTNIADRKSRQMIHRAKKINPEGLVVAVGCYVQAAGEKLQSDQDIDLIVGNNKKVQIVSLVENALKVREHSQSGNDLEYERAAVMDINHTKDYEALHVSHVREHTRAYIKIQDGCNQFCSYCIIPYARGRVRSRREEDIISEVQTLVDGGYKEIVLTGIHISSYGLDFENEDYNRHSRDSHLIRLIEKLGQVPGLLRIRLGSLEPRIITEEFAGRLRNVAQICPHFHLSLQSGCDATLARMNRHYTAAQYDESVRILRKYFDAPAITTDVIVGFPQESEEEFEASAAFLEHIRFAKMHVFKYSRRQGTKAASMEGQIDETVKNQRSARLIQMDQKLQAEFIRQWQGKTAQVLLEEREKIDGKNYLTGYTKEYIHVAVPEREGLEANTVFSGKLSLRIHEEYVICERMD